MKPSLYLETTIPSFLIGSTSSVLATAAHQAATVRWWKEKRGEYEVFISSVVIGEIQKGDVKVQLQHNRLARTSAGVR
jgi:predicted nucleic acid-binding protein